MSDRQGLIWDAAERGNIRLRGCEVKEYERMKDFIRDNPGCTASVIKHCMKLTWRVPMYLAYGVTRGEIWGDQGHPEKWWLR